MDMPKERITRPIIASELFARDALREAGREDLFRWVDEEGIAKDVAQAIARLAVLEGGTLADDQGTVVDQPDQLHALIGGKWHMSITKEGWKVVLEAAVLVLSVLKASSGDLVEAGVIGVHLLLLINEVARVVHRLTPEQLTIYLAVKAASLNRPSGATLNEVAACLQSVPNGGTTQPVLSSLEKELERLVMDGILRHDNDRFRCL